ncbi:hypothetical protein PI124_g13136 [Phytophthora idaei]|nr:hypothetical protein PI125_g8038 [Phytophthora idaei]KAG3159773.1 hypothetical protein PI126_g7221 [Phytophthora idaei]KAG3242011.1 hypothetical protein PI124_g13136 [Phytophthora idaei]
MQLIGMSLPVDIFYQLRDKTTGDRYVANVVRAQ